MLRTKSAMIATCVPIGQTTAKIVLRSRLASLAHLSEWTHALAQATGLSARCGFRLELVLTETVSNIIEHAYALGDEGVITVLVMCEPGLVVVQVEDDGCPFDPTAAPAHSQPASLEEARIGGLGVHLIRSYTEQWEYRRIDQKNQLRMTIACDD